MLLDSIKGVYEVTEVKQQAYNKRLEFAVQLAKKADCYLKHLQSQYRFQDQTPIVEIMKYAEFKDFYVSDELKEKFKNICLFCFNHKSLEGHNNTACENEYFKRPKTNSENR